MQKRVKKQVYRPITGFFAGFLIPLIIFVAVYFIRETEISFKDYVISLTRLNALIKLGSLCVFANLLVFMGFIRINYDRAARGVLGATIIYAIIILIVKAL
jgi:hypothetical protein